MKRSERVALLTKVLLFANLPQPELEHLAETLQPHEFAQGTLMMREGESDEHIYILLEGEVEVIKALGTSDERQLAIRPPGSLFGEMSLFDPQGSHTASVRAHTPAYVLEMTRQDFDRLLHRYPTLVYEMVRQMSRHLVRYGECHDPRLAREEPPAHPGLSRTQKCAGTAGHQGKVRKRAGNCPPDPGEYPAR